ncbi:MAG: M20/M25/M40 family metallo-hydrolase [Lachnospiraceae bacterium]|nr:M20/M25/M40 family metallo-hydrolase [Lachnospiraceae bacterium]
MDRTDFNGSLELHFVQKYAKCRPAGSEAERSTARAIAGALSYIGLRPVTEKFHYQKMECLRAELRVPAFSLDSMHCEDAEQKGMSSLSSQSGQSSPSLPLSLRQYVRRIPAAGYCTALSGARTAKAPLLFVGGGRDVRMKTAAGRIVMTDRPVTAEMAASFERAGAVGFVSVYGAPTDLDIDIDPFYQRLPRVPACTLPGIAIHWTEASRILDEGLADGNTTVQLYVHLERRTVTSCNVYADIPSEGADDAAHCAGRDPENDHCAVLSGPEDNTRLSETHSNGEKSGQEYGYIALSAHMDSVPQGPGAYDNLSANAILLLMADYFHKHPLKTALRFIFFGAEEDGLKGSRAYVLKHKNEMKEVGQIREEGASENADHRTGTHLKGDSVRCLLNMNIDLAGQILGTDVIGVTGDPQLQTWVQDFLDANGFGAETKNQVWSSDSNCFAWMGVPAMTLDRDGFGMHTRHDRAEYISAKALGDQAYLYAALAKALADHDRSGDDPRMWQVPAEMAKELQRRLGQ